MTVATGADTGVTFALEDEDHTLANSLRYLLNRKYELRTCGKFFLQSALTAPECTALLLNLCVCQERRRAI